MSGSAQPSQTRIDTTNPRVAPFQDAVLQQLFAQLSARAGETPGVMQGLPNFGDTNIFSQLYGQTEAGAGGGGGDVSAPRPRPGLSNIADFLEGAIQSPTPPLHPAGGYPTFGGGITPLAPTPPQHPAEGYPAIRGSGIIASTPVNWGSRDIRSFQPQYTNQYSVDFPMFTPLPRR